MIVRGVVAMLVLVAIALLARRLGADGYGWFGVATALAAIVLGPALQSIAAIVTRSARGADEYAALLIGVPAWRHRWTADPVMTTRAFVAPIALTAFADALLHWVDRLFLLGQVSQADLGIYAAGVDLSRQFFIPLTSLLYIAWLPRLTSAQTAAALRESAAQRTHIEMRYALAVTTLLLPALTLFILLRVELIATVFGDAYAAQANLLPWIAIAAVLGALRGAVLDTGLYREGRTRALLRNAVIGAFVSVTLNALYAPRYGVVAAVAAALVSQSLAFLVAWHASRDIITWRIPRVQFERIVFCWAAMAFVLLLLPAEIMFAARAAIAALAYAGALVLVNGAGVRDWLAARVRRVD